MTATLTVWKFPTPLGADDAVVKLLTLQKQELIAVRDAAVVSWKPDGKRPRTRQLHNLAGAGALSGSFWGLLFGFLFFMPLLGMAIGALAGGMSGKFADIGIDDDFIKEVREKVTPGTSALFVLTEGEVLDRIKAAFPDNDAELLHTNLSSDQEAKLRDVFADVSL